MAQCAGDGGVGVGGWKQVCGGLYCVCCTDPNSFLHTEQCPPETSKARRDTQSNELIEINPQTEGKVYTRCFCLEEPQNSKVGGQGGHKGDCLSSDLTKVCH
jgi:hypothetical protein